MTREEARLTLQDNFGYLSQEHPRILEALRVALDALSQPSLPSDLDEAAEETLRRAYPGDAYYYVGRPARRLFKEGFKAGAEWMAKQGVTKEAVIGMATEEIFINVSQQTLNELDLCPGDKVIVQIRKK